MQPHARHADTHTIGDDVLGLGEKLVPLFGGLQVHGTNIRVPVAQQLGDKMSADETAGAGDEDEVVLHILRLLLVLQRVPCRRRTGDVSITLFRASK